MEASLPIVTVIVPVYNAEKYLERCLDSITNQTLKPIEIIIINDGSTDNSKGIILKFALRYKNIIFIEQENLGVSAARNKGLEIAKGKYIGYVDADDWIEPQMFEKLYLSIISHECDLAICNVNVTDGFYVKPRLVFESKNLNFLIERSKIINELMQFKYDYGNWNKLYSAEIIKNNDICFNHKNIRGEDLLFNLHYFLVSNQGICIDECLYSYFINPESITQTESNDLICELKKVIERFEELAISLNRNEELATFSKGIAMICYHELNKRIYNVLIIKKSTKAKYKLINNEISNFLSIGRKYVAKISLGSPSLIEYFKLSLLKYGCKRFFSIMEILSFNFRHARIYKNN